MDDKYKVLVPEGQAGKWRVERFTVSEQEASLERMRSMFSSSRGRGVPAGTYTRLVCGGDVVMSDTPDEVRDHLRFIYRATGRVLIHGLGLGMVLQAVACRPEVTHVTVVELNEDVINLVAPHYRAMFGAKVEIIQGDAYTWKPRPGAVWDCAWHDVWNELCTDNLPLMSKLHRRFGSRVTVFQGSWCRELLLHRRRQEKRQGW
jgi:hypothetical protein